MSASKRVRVGVIGAGAWAATNHIPILKSRDDVELVVACRPGKEPLKTLKDKFGFAYVTEDYREALQYPLDVVVVASPPALHYEHSAAALEANAHVLCEKPFTVEPADAWRLVELAERKARHLVISYGFNWLPAVDRARELLAQHPIGNIRHSLTHIATDVWQLLHGIGFYQEADPRFLPDAATWSNPSQSGGGFAPGQLSHGLALMLWLSGLVPAEVSAALEPQGVDLYDALLLRFTNGSIGVASGVSTQDGGAPREQMEVRLTGDAGHFVFDLEREQLATYNPTERLVSVDLAKGDGLYRCDGPVHAIVDLALGRRVEIRSTGELGARVVDIVHAAAVSAKAHMPIQIPGRDRVNA
jgi:predicted dehydrogenase